MIVSIHLLRMVKIGLFVLLMLFCYTTNAQNGIKLRGKKQQPNIIFILTDDLGYGDLGCYGQKKIETPNIDKLAEHGMKFTQCYAGSTVCAPSRSVLLTGRHTGHAFVRGNDEGKSRGDVWNYRAVEDDLTLEGQSPLPDSTITIANLLHQVGYATGMVGKWGLGAPQTNSIPTKKGFDFFYGYNCQRQAHTYYPLHLYENEKRVHLDNDTVAPHTGFVPKGADPYDLDSYKRFNLKEYSPDLMFKKLIQFIDVNKSKPFFMYWATPIPHLALQAPEEWVDYYVKKFGDEKPYMGVGDQGYFPQRYPHAAYAAMVSYLDWQVGQLIQHLKDLGIYDNTLIIFTSDNGPTYHEGGIDSPWFNSGGPFKSDDGWVKETLHEAGIRVPFIASWPGHIKPGTQSDLISASWDVLPTLCDIAGAKVPSYADGISILPTLEGKPQRKKHEYLYWEYPEADGEQAVRMDKWKALRQNIRKENNMAIQLFDLSDDIQELNNVAEEHPDVVNEMAKIMRAEHQKSDNENWQFHILDD